MDKCKRFAALVLKNNKEERTQIEWHLSFRNSIRDKVLSGMAVLRRLHSAPWSPRLPGRTETLFWRASVTGRDRCVDASRFSSSTAAGSVRRSSGRRGGRRWAHQLLVRWRPPGGLALRPWPPVGHSKGLPVGPECAPTVDYRRHTARMTGTQGTGAPRGYT
jgi:hypothetical protein